MNKIGLFYGSDTGVTQEIAEKIFDLLGGKDKLEKIDVYHAKIEQFVPFERIIIGLSTWHDGQLQSDWDSFYNKFEKVDFTGKEVAIFGLGDQYGYSTYYVDGMGTLAEVILKNGGKIIGKWPTEGYEHDASKAEMEPGFFVGLALDEDNQPELTQERVAKWVELLASSWK